MRKYKFTVRGNEYEVEIKGFEKNIIKMDVNGSAYKVELHKEIKTSKTPTLVRSAIVNPKGSHKLPKPEGASAKLTIKAPLPGIILSLYVKEGDMVKKGDKLLMYEAMKMENLVLAERDGQISNIKVNVGDNVLQEDPLLELE